MKTRTPVPRDQRPPLPTFAPVPRKPRHDGWTPERQRAFIEALADTGSVSRACAMVNMTTVGAYYLRRQPGADEFRRAWEAALDYGVARMKDLAFERAVEGTLVPVITGGKLIGWRRIYNDRLLMFCLRHYGEDANGKRTKIEYFSTRATAAAGAGALIAATPSPLAGEGRGEGAASAAEASTTTVRTIIHGAGASPDLAATASTLDGFAGIELDARAQAEIQAVLVACAARHRAVAGTADDEAEPFIAAESIELPPDPGSHDYKERRRAAEWKPTPPAYHVTASPYDMVEHSPHLLVQRDEQHRSNETEPTWEMLDQEEELARIDEAVRQVAESKAKKQRGRKAKKCE